MSIKRTKAAVAVFMITALAITAVAVVAQSPKASSVNSVTITGGFETDPRDHGRPVVLIASMLGVTPDVFREAFSGVTPTKVGSPTGDEARTNKKALLKVLAPYGITNEKLDEVSNYYRYKGSLGQTWPQTKAAATAVLVDGKLTGINITNVGAGYTSVPKVVIRSGNVMYTGVATVVYTDDFKSNGSIGSISLKTS